MTHAVVYLDASALVKLVFEEPETAALQAFLTAWPNRVSSTLARVEVLRVAASVDDPAVLNQARDVLGVVDLIRITEPVINAAIGIEPATVRALDAIHLGTALSLGAGLAGAVIYDRRLAGAARRAGVTVWAPA